jgi:hypothetical protein
MKRFRILITVAAILGIAAGPALAGPAQPSASRSPAISVPPIPVPQAGEDVVTAVENLVGTTVQCRLTQSPGPAQIIGGVKGWTEKASNKATTSCNATLVPSVTTYVKIEDLGVVKHTVSKTAYGKGYGPVTVSASQFVPTQGEPGPTIRYTFISTATTNIGNTARVCQQLTIDLLGDATKYTENC